MNARLSIFGSIAVLTLLVLWSGVFHRAKVSEFVSTKVELSQVSLALKDYVTTHGNAFPMQLSEIVSEPKYADPSVARLLVSNPDHAQCHCSWLYFYGWTMSDPSDSIVVAAPRAYDVKLEDGQTHHWRAVLRRDFSVDQVEEADFEALVATQLRGKWNAANH